MLRRFYRENYLYLLLHSGCKGFSIRLNPFREIVVDSRDSFGSFTVYTRIRARYMFVEWKCIHN